MNREMMTTETKSGVQIPNIVRSLGRCLAAVVIAGSFVFWVWAFTPWARNENPARLDDRSFVAWADERCALAQARIADLPSPREADSPQQRASQITQGTDEIADLVAELRIAASELSESTSGEGPSDADLVHHWLADWETYLSDRRAHETKLHAANVDTPDRELWFLMSDVMAGGVYTERMDGFARLNNMDACQVPGDV